MSSKHTRTHRLRLAAAAVTALVAVSAAGCKGGSRGSEDATQATGTSNGSAATPAPAPAPSEMNPSPTTAPAVDPTNVKAAMTWDAASKTMTLPMVSGLNKNAGGWNFDGQARGSMTIIVPVGTKVTMPFYNEDIVPHSLGIVDGSPANIPSSPSQAAFPQAATSNFEQGIATNEGSTVVFTADKPGTYLALCGVPGHAASGMWVVFQVSPGATSPQITTKS